MCLYSVVGQYHGISQILLYEGVSFDLLCMTSPGRALYKELLFILYVLNRIEIPSRLSQMVTSSIYRIQL